MAAGVDLLKGATAAAVDSSHMSLQVDADGDLHKTDSAGNAFPIDEVYLTIELTDVSTASSAWVVSPLVGVITRVQTILHSAISAGDAVCTLEINGTAVDGLSITIAQSGSAAGDVDSDTPTAAHATTDVAVGDKIELVSDGGSTTAARVTAIVTISRRVL